MWRSPGPLGGEASISSTRRVLLNGFGPNSVLEAAVVTDYEISFTPPRDSVDSDLTPTFQAVVADPGNPPLFFRNTEAVQTSYDRCRTTVYSSLFDDDFATHDLLGTTNFYGTDYTQMFLSSNGLVTFGGGNINFFTPGC